MVAAERAHPQEVGLGADHVSDLEAPQQAAHHRIALVPLPARLHRDRDEAVARQLEAQEHVREPRRERGHDEPDAPHVVEPDLLVEVSLAEGAARRVTEVPEAPDLGLFARERDAGGGRLIRGPVAVRPGCARVDHERRRDDRRERDGAQGQRHASALAAPLSARR
jgi:hypothetical protein